MKEQILSTLSSLYRNVKGVELTAPHQIMQRQLSLRFSRVFPETPLQRMQTPMD